MVAVRHPWRMRLEHHRPNGAESQTSRDSMERDQVVGCGSRAASRSCFPFVHRHEPRCWALYYCADDGCQSGGHGNRHQPAGRDSGAGTDRAGAGFDFGCADRRVQVIAPFGSWRCRICSVVRTADGWVKNTARASFKAPILRPVDCPGGLRAMRSTLLLQVGAPVPCGNNRSHPNCVWPSQDCTGFGVKSPDR